MNIQENILQPFNPNENLLLELLCREIKPDTLWSIAEADYGHGAEEYRKILEHIQREKRIPKLQFDTTLSEVVELTRWREPERTTSRSYDWAQKNNLAIAFSCTVLLTVPSDWYYNRDGEHSTVIRLIQAIRILSSILPSLWEKAGALLAWRITENETSSEDLPFFLYGLLLCGLHGKLADESELLTLTDHLIAEEGRCRADLQVHGYLRIDQGWLLGLTHFNQLLDDWSNTAHWLLEESDRIQNPDLRSRLLQIAGWLRHTSK